MLISNEKTLSIYDSYKKKLIRINLEGRGKDNPIKIYSCGPTVYNYLHIGNLFAVYLGDILTKSLKYCGAEVNFCLNITDIGHLVSDGDNGQNVSSSEDKMEKIAKIKNQSPLEIAKFYTDDFIKQAGAINITLPDGRLMPRATDYINEQMQLAIELLLSSRAKILEDGIYYDFKANSDINLEGLPFSEGSNEFTRRDIIGENNKKPEDFSLWKFVDENTIQKFKFSDFSNIKSYKQLIDKHPEIVEKWGVPGWHSECVAMICSVLGLGQESNSNISNNFSFTRFSDNTKLNPVIDIHTGGEDHYSVHHKNEILESRSLGFELSNAWVHNKFLLVDSKKMSKSAGNVYLIVGNLKETGFVSIEEAGNSNGYNFTPISYRLLLLEHHFGQQINFTFDKLQSSQNRLTSLKKMTNMVYQYCLFKGVHLDRVGFDSSLKHDFEYLLLDNLDTPKVMEKFQTEITELVGLVNSDYKNNDNLELIIERIKTLAKLDKMVLNLDLFYTPSVKLNNLVNARMIAKTNKDYPKADLIRQSITDLGFYIDDCVFGSVVYL
jgi:cysteinyl-tRNA synthetase